MVWVRLFVVGRLGGLVVGMPSVVTTFVGGCGGAEAFAVVVLTLVLVLILGCVGLVIFVVGLLGLLFGVHVVGGGGVGVGSVRAGIVVRVAGGLLVVALVVLLLVLVSFFIFFMALLVCPLGGGARAW